MGQNATPSPLEPASAFSDLPALSWRDKTGARAFYCDAFISHRRADASAEIVTLLAERGVHAWHDKNADLSDEVVRDHIRFALSSSRTVIAFISDGEPLSDWCRAEYQPGLSAGKKGNFKRVIVVLLEQGLPVPEDLRACTAFLKRDIDQLAKYLKEANQLPLANESLIRNCVQTKFVIGELPFAEIAVLGKRRVDKLASSDSDDPVPWETWARDLIASDLRVPSGGWLDANPDIAPSVEEPLWNFYLHLGSALLKRKDVLVRLAPFEIVDFVLAPLGWLQTKPAYARLARLLIAQLCLAVAENSNYAQRAMAWLVLSDSISKNPNLEDARMAMWTALDDVHATEKHLESVEKYASPDESDKARRRLQELQSEGVAHCRLALARLTSTLQ